MDIVGLRVAGLDVWLDARGTGIRLGLPPSHARFAAPGSATGGLVLSVRSGRLPSSRAWQSVFVAEDMWALWRERSGRWVFVPARRSKPGRAIFVAADFARGDVVGHFDAARDGQPVYPLQDIEIKIVANWLAETGDLILHAVGAEIDGVGCCFCGPSGAGKSTLAARLAESAAILGEDQVILRCLDGRFWIFGTPWHLDPGRCSPQGVPLKKLFFLDRTDGPGVRACPPVEGVARLMQSAFVPYYRPEAVARILDNLALLAQGIPFFSLGHDLDTDVRPLIAAA